MLHTVRPLLLLFICAGLCTALSAGENSFTGLWVGPKSDTSSFSLDLIQKGDHLEGYHTSVVRGGKRLDAVLPDEGKPSITGTIVDGVAHVQFHSGYSEDGGGEAVLTLQGSKLEWKITKSSGTHYLPDASEMHREKNTGAKKSK